MEKRKLLAWLCRSCSLDEEMSQLNLFNTHSKEPKLRLHGVLLYYAQGGQEVE